MMTIIYAAIITVLNITLGAYFAFNNTEYSTTEANFLRMNFVLSMAFVIYIFTRKSKKGK